MALMKVQNIGRRQRPPHRIVQTVNEHLRNLADGVRLVEFDQNGLHNPCRILVLPWDGKMGDEELLAKTLTGEIQEVDFSPQDWMMKTGISVVLDQCYYVEPPDLDGILHGKAADLPRRIREPGSPMRIPCAGILDHNSLPIRGQAYSVQSTCIWAPKSMELVHSWLEYADQNGYAFGTTRMWSSTRHPLTLELVDKSQNILPL